MKVSDQALRYDVPELLMTCAMETCERRILELFDRANGADGVPIQVWREEKPILVVNLGEECIGLPDIDRQCRSADKHILLPAGLTIRMTHDGVVGKVVSGHS